MLDRKGLILEIDRLPLEADDFTASQTVESGQQNGELDGIAFYYFE